MFGFSAATAFGFWTLVVCLVLVVSTASGTAIAAGDNETAKTLLRVSGVIAVVTFFAFLLGGLFGWV